MHSGSLQSSPTLCDPIDCGLPGFSEREWGFPRKEYWSILANTGCHTLLEHYISCCPTHQLPWVLVLPEPLRPKWLHQLHIWPLTGPNLSPPGQPQEQSPADDPDAEVEIKPQLKPRAVWLRKKTQNPPISCTICRLNPHNQLGGLCVYGIYKRSLRAPTKENVLVLIAVNIGGENREE